MQLNRKVRPEILDSVALLVIDAQDSFIDTLKDKEAFKQRAAFAIEAARCLKLHTIFTEQAPEKLGRTNADLFKLAYKPKVFSKQTFSALGAPGIQAYLRDKEIYNLLVVGLETPICLYQTGLQATDEDIDVTYLSDCIGARRPQDAAPTLDALTRMGCQVLPSETIFYSLLSDTVNPYFRAFTQIVKAFDSEDFSLETYLENRPTEVNETPERPQKPQRKERPQKDRKEGRKPQRDDQGSEDRDDKRQGDRRNNRRSDRREDSSPRDEKPTDSEHENRSGDDSEERRGRKRGRRRGRGRGRDGQESSNDSQNDRNSAPRPDWRERKDDREHTPRAERQSEPKQESTPATAKPVEPKESPKPKAKIEAAEKPPAKKAAKKAAKKVAKKAAKKVAKKAAKKVAKKKAKEPAAE